MHDYNIPHQETFFSFNEEHFKVMSPCLGNVMHKESLSTDKVFDISNERQTIHIKGGNIYFAFA